MTVPTAYLKAFEPIEAFGRAERERWAALAGAAARAPRTVFLSPKVAVRALLDASDPERDRADLLERDGRLFVCPHRTRLRLLGSVLALRRSISSEALPAFVSESEIEEVNAELERLRRERPTWRNHILQSSWEIPLRWFVLFDDAERRLERRGDGETARYETTMPAARGRVRKALSVLRRALPDPAVVGLVAELSAWLDQFDRGSIVVLEYGDIPRLLGPGGLDEDRSARDIWSAISCLQEGDQERAAAFYGIAAERWSRVRALESAN